MDLLEIAAHKAHNTSTSQSDFHPAATTTVHVEAAHDDDHPIQSHSFLVGAPELPQATTVTHVVSVPAEPTTHVVHADPAVPLQVHIEHDHSVPEIHVEHSLPGNLPPEIHIEAGSTDEVQIEIRDEPPVDPYIPLTIEAAKRVPPTDMIVEQIHFLVPNRYHFLKAFMDPDFDKRVEYIERCCECTIIPVETIDTYKSDFQSFVVYMHPGSCRQAVMHMLHTLMKRIAGEKIGGIRPVDFPGAHKWQPQPVQIHINPEDADMPFGTSINDHIKNIESTLKPPMHVRGHAVGSTEVLVTWEPPVTEGAAILNYSVNLYDNRTGLRQDLVAPHDAYGMRLSGLRPDTHYFIRVAIETTHGRGAYSSQIAVTTERNDTVPTHLRATNVTATQIDLIWDTPRNQGDVERYVLKIKVPGENDVTKQKIEKGKHKASLKRLNPSTTYILSVSAEDKTGKQFVSKTIKVRTANTNVGYAVDFHRFIPDPVGQHITQKASRIAQSMHLNGKEHTSPKKTGSGVTKAKETTKHVSIKPKQKASQIRIHRPASLSLSSTMVEPTSAAGDIIVAVKSGKVPDDEGIRAEVIGEDNLELSWDSPHSEVLRYQLTINGIQNDFRLRRIVPATQGRFAVTALQPDSSYEISLIIICKGGNIRKRMECRTSASAETAAAVAATKKEEPTTDDTGFVSGNELQHLDTDSSSARMANILKYFNGMPPDWLRKRQEKERANNKKERPPFNLLQKDSGEVADEKKVKSTSFTGDGVGHEPSSLNKVQSGGDKSSATLEQEDDTQTEKEQDDQEKKNNKSEQN